jgi:hypothetical protein
MPSRIPIHAQLEFCKLCNLEHQEFSPYPPISWTKSNTWMYPIIVRKVFIAILCAHKRKDTLFGLLPRDILYMLLERTARSYTRDILQRYSNHCDRCEHFFILSPDCCFCGDKCYEINIDLTENVEFIKCDNDMSRKGISTWDIYKEWFRTYTKKGKCWLYVHDGTVSTLNVKNFRKVDNTTIDKISYNTEPVIGVASNVGITLNCAYCEKEKLHYCTICQNKETDKKIVLMTLTRVDKRGIKKYDKKLIIDRRCEKCIDGNRCLWCKYPADQKTQCLVCREIFYYCGGCKSEAPLFHESKCPANRKNDFIESILADYEDE